MSRNILCLINEYDVDSLFSKEVQFWEKYTTWRKLFLIIPLTRVYEINVMIIFLIEFTIVLFSYRFFPLHNQTKIRDFLLRSIQQKQQFIWSIFWHFILCLQILSAAVEWLWLFTLSNAPACAARVNTVSYFDKFFSINKKMSKNCALCSVEKYITHISSYEFFEFQFANYNENIVHFVKKILC